MKHIAAVVALFLALWAEPVRAGGFTFLPLGSEGQDTWAYSFLPFSVRNGDALYAFTDVSDEGTHAGYAFVQFPLPTGLLLPGETVVSAELWFTYSFGSGFSGSEEAGTMSAHVVGQPWSETSLTWSNKPSFGAAVATVGGIAGVQTVVFDVTQTARSWATGALPNHGFALTSPTTRVLGSYSFGAAGIDRFSKPLLIIETGPSGILDADSDGVADGTDNCPLTANALQEDADADGVGDACDNCTQTPNADQRDTNGDAYGNACDPDFNGDEIVNFLDLSTLKQRFFTTDADADLNGDGLVNFLDLSRFKQWFLSSPGPSAVAP